MFNVLFVAQGGGRLYAKMIEVAELPSVGRALLMSREGIPPSAAPYKMLGPPEVATPICVFDVLAERVAKLLEHGFTEQPASLATWR